MKTQYQPVRIAGDLGPKFDFWTLAALWIIDQPDPRWTVQVIAAPPPLAQAA